MQGKRSRLQREFPVPATQPGSPAKSRKPPPAASALPARRYPSAPSPPQSSRRFFGELLELLCLVLCGERADDVVQFTVHDALDLVQGQADAVVGDAALREVVGADALGAVARPDQRFARRSGLGREVLLLLVLD